MSRIRFPECRLLGHSWIFTTVHREGRDYVQGRECTRCRAQRYVRIHHRTGKIVSSSYHYEAGYRVKGGVDKDTLLLKTVKEFK